MYYPHHDPPLPMAEDDFGVWFAHFSDAHISRGLGGRGLIAPSPCENHVLASLWKEERGKIYVP